MNKGCERCGRQVIGDNSICALCEMKELYERGGREAVERALNEILQEPLLSECAMCGVERPNLDKNRHCARCRQIWNS